ncbi:MAG: Zn-dependent exopeptidase M28 [Chloroflexi bacterium]|nr:Zn-dependent exopeptidase M28 [Chloroflexota bacterium]
MNETIQRWYAHICTLVEECPQRGSTTEGERQAAAYAARVFEQAGYTPTTDRYPAARSSFQVYVIFGGLMIAAFVAYSLGGVAGRVAAIGLSGLSLFSISRELTFRSNPIRRLIAFGESQNVHAVLEPSGEHTQDLILMGHLDVMRTPVFFRHRRLVDIWRVYAVITIFTFFIAFTLYSVSLFSDGILIRQFGMFNAVMSLILVAINVQADLTPYSPGANDNATGAAMVLTLAEVLRSNPLEKTRVWFVASGCEEVKHYGAIDFFKRYAPQFKNPKALVFEMLGTAGPGWLAREGVVYPFLTRAAPELVALCEEIAAEQPHWKASGTRVSGGNTEMSDAIRYGVPAVTIIGITADAVRLGYRGEELYWHRPDDTPDKLNPEVMARAYGFIRALIDRIDGRG